MNFKETDFVYKYRLLKFIGNGCFGEVWRAMDATIDSVLALKIIPFVDESPLNSLLQEARLGNKLVHDNVVIIQSADLWKDKDGNKYILLAMPFYHNGSVVSLMNRKVILDLDSTIKCLIDILKGLEYIHDLGYFHCDIKPNNILVDDNNSYVLSDYGLASYSPEHKSIFFVNGYIQHLPPENLKENRYDMQSDVYEVGVTGIRLINGLDVLEKQMLEHPDDYLELSATGKILSKCIKPYVPRKLKHILLKATDVDCCKRGIVVL